MNRIKFMSDWDKLKEPNFSTIRSYRKDKETYYRSKVGEQFSLIRVRHEWSQRGHKIGSAILKSVSVDMPGELAASFLQKDVMLGGKPSQPMLERLLAMPKAIVLEFENNTGPLAVRSVEGGA